jgi:hypothetical protein
MKTISRAAFLFAILAAVAGAAYAQADKRIAAIDAQVSEINKASRTYKKKTKDVFGISTEGAGVSYYRSGKELKKISTKIYGETYNAVSEFYFRNNALIFVNDRVNHYDSSLPADVKVVRVERIRSYFDKGKMFRLINDKKTIASTSDDFTDAEKRNNEALKEILKAEKHR